MNFSFSAIRLYSTAPERLASFVSNILETQVHYDESGEMVFSLGPLNFKILETKKKKIGEEIELKVQDQAQLEDLSKLIEFYNYKNNEKIKFSFADDSLIVSDPDGRKWPFIVDYRQIEHTRLKNKDESKKAFRLM